MKDELVVLLGDARIGRFEDRAVDAGWSRCARVRVRRVVARRPAGVPALNLDAARDGGALGRLGVCVHVGAPARQRAHPRAMGQAASACFTATCRRGVRLRTRGSSASAGRSRRRRCTSTAIAGELPPAGSPRRTSCGARPAAPHERPCLGDTRRGDCFRDGNGTAARYVERPSASSAALTAGRSSMRRRYAASVGCSSRFTWATFPHARSV